MLADRPTIKTVIRNLLSNSIKFTPRGGKVETNAEKIRDADKAMIRINITDNGAGMSEESIQNLFKIQHVNSTKGTENEKGTGLGLIICKDFVEQNGGSISISSQQGKGTKTVVCLPANQAY